MKPIHLHLKGVRSFSSFLNSQKHRSFSVITRQQGKYNPISLGVYQSSQDLKSLGDKEVKEMDTSKRQKKLSLSSDVCFTKDKAFLKTLAWINLASKDKESISLSRLIAYNIFSQIHKTDDVDSMDDTIVGITKAFGIILKTLEKASKKITTKNGLTSKVCEVYSQGNVDISNLITFLNSGDVKRELIFTKEVVGRTNEGIAHVTPGLAVDVGHASHSFINDQTNYRVELIQPLIVMREEVTEDSAKKIVELSEQNKNGVVFITKHSNPTLKDYLVELKSKSPVNLVFMDLSESTENPEELYNNLVEGLSNSEPLTDEFSFVFKSVSRLIMESNKSYFIDDSLSQLLNQNNPLFREIVDVHLKGANETWMQKFKINVVDSYESMKDSLGYGIVPELKTSLFLANQELKEYYSENSDIQEGIEIVQKAIDSSILENLEEKVDFTDYSFELHINESLEDGTFIPRTKATKVVADIITICDFLIQSKHSDE